MDRQPDLTKSQLFLDDTWIEDQQRLTRLWHKADTFPEPVLRPEMPWEETVVRLYGTVFKLEDRWRMYYVGGRYRGGDTGMVLCVAESDDGIHWERPIIGEIEYQGSKENNIVLRPIQSPSVCYDPEDEEFPFKLFDHGRPGPGAPGALMGAVSKEGYRWTRLPGALLSPVGDRKTAMSSKVDGKYVVFTKPAKMRDRYGARVVSISESEDFRTFSEPQLILKPDLIDSPNIEFYGFAAFPYSDMYVGLIERYNVSPDIGDITLAWSYDLRNWQRPVQREAFIGPEYPWNRLWSGVSSGAPVQVGNQLWFHFSGKHGAHSHVKNGPPEYGVVGLATITVDRFASISASHAVMGVDGPVQGRLVTKPMTWPGGNLLLNASTTRDLDAYPLDGGGSMSIEVWDDEDRAVEGFSGEHRADFHGNVPSREKVDPATIRWPEGRSLDDLAGRKIKLVFHMQDSHLYSFRAAGR